MNISYCPSCCKPGTGEFCVKCRQALFSGRRVSPELPFSRPDYNRRKLETAGRLSISGVQSKHSVKLVNRKLDLTEEGGQYILKPAPSGEFENLPAMPANEHITMQIARQVFGLKTAECAVVFFREDHSQAYLTKRFDVLADGTRLAQEDFAQIARMSEESHGRNYKYDSSYENIAALMKKHVSAYSIEVEKFFRLVLFNFLVNNGDAHLKNFSLYREPAMNVYIMTPAYDLLNTRLHIPTDTVLALDVFDSGYETESYSANGFFARDDFVEFGEKIGIPTVRVIRFIDEFTSRFTAIADLLDQSFLVDSLKAWYKDIVADRIKTLQYSYRHA